MNVCSKLLDACGCCRYGWLLLLTLWLTVVPVLAGRLVIKIQAANPSEDKTQPVEIRASLPARVTTNDIINLAGLNLGYDVKSDSYYVYGTLQLAPKEIAVREVELEDIWTFDETALQALETRAVQLAGQLRSTPYAQQADEARQGVEQEVAAVLAYQRENRISLVSPVRHIQAYETNVKAVQRIKHKVGEIENLALAAGINPGDALVGEDRAAADPNRDAHVPAEFGEAIVRITVRNSSTTQNRKIRIRRELPPEVTIDDVLETSGLSVRFDPTEGVTYVYDEALELAPQEAKTFTIRIRDKWNVNEPRMDFLSGRISEFRAVIADRVNLQAVANMLDEAEAQLTVIAETAGPAEFTPAYIAFYRRQADQLDEIEKSLNRIGAALKPLETRRGFTMPAPDKKTTWLIIYGILGFLALMSLLFFLRWFVRSS